MFRRLPTGLPKDPTWPADLKELGYFVDSTDHIKSIAHPEDGFRFFITNNQRYNDVHREAMHACIRNEVLARLATLNVHPLYLPTLTNEPPSRETPHLPILTTPQSALRRKKRVIVVVNRLFEDLAIWAYRVLSKHGGVSVGSAVSFVEETLRRSGTGDRVDGDETPGIILLNPGQLLYSYKHGHAMTPIAWDALPRPSAVHPAAKVHPVHNHVPGNATPAEHAAFVFEKVIRNEEFVAKDAKLFLVGLGDGGDVLMNYLAEEWPANTPTISAFALTAPVPIHRGTISTRLRNPSFRTFLARRARAWTTSPHPLNTPLANADFDPASPTLATVKPADVPGVPHFQIPTAPTEDGDAPAGVDAEVALFPTVAGGHAEYAECVMPAAYGAVLDWFGEVERGGEGYVNGRMEVAEEVRRQRIGEIVETGW